MIVLLVLALGLEGAGLWIGIELLARLKAHEAVQFRLEDVTLADGVHEARLDEHAAEFKKLWQEINRLREARGEERIA